MTPVRLFKDRLEPQIHIPAGFPTVSQLTPRVRVQVTSAYWNFYGGHTFGITLIPMLIGVAMLFFNGRSAAGWLLTAAGALFILAGVLANLHIYFQPTSLFNTLLMLILLVGGLELIARAMRPHPTWQAE